MSTNNLNGSPATTEHQAKQRKSKSEVTIDEHAWTLTIQAVPSANPKQTVDLKNSNFVTLGPIVALHPAEFGKVIVSNAETILKTWKIIQNHKASVKLLSSGTDTEHHCPPSLRHSCPLKISDRFKDNE